MEPVDYALKSQICEPNKLSSLCIAYLKDFFCTDEKLTNRDMLKKVGKTH